jgi:cysteine desulfurase
MIYLDHNATTPVDPEVSDAVFSSLKRDLGNPSSLHLPGRKANESIGSSRKCVAALLNCSAEEICFTSGGTESNNLAIVGTAMLHKKGHIITSCVEHPSVATPCRYLESLGFDVTYAPVNNEGMVEMESIEKSLRKDTILISVMHSNNETGVIQPVDQIGSLARDRGITFHVDAAQSVGKMYFSTDSPVDLITIVSHKFYGPKGVGALYIRNGTRLKPIIFGAGHERGLRPGTENVAGIVGLGKACQIASRDIALRVSHTTSLRDLLFTRLKSAVPDMSLNGHETRRLPNTMNVRIPGVLSVELVDLLADRVAVSSGSACHAGKPEPSRVLKNMGLSDEEALSSLRLSVGQDNTEEEIEEAARIIAAAVKELREKPA